MRRCVASHFPSQILDLLEQNRSLRSEYTLSLLSDNLRQDIHHGPLVASISSSNFCRATPESIAFAAIIAPSRKSAADPPRKSAAAAFMITNVLASSLRSPESTALTIRAF